MKSPEMCKFIIQSKIQSSEAFLRDWVSWDDFLSMTAEEDGEAAAREQDNLATFLALVAEEPELENHYDIGIIVALVEVAGRMGIELDQPFIDLANGLDNIGGD